MAFEVYGALGTTMHLIMRLREQFKQVRKLPNKLEGAIKKLGDIQQVILKIDGRIQENTDLNRSALDALDRSLRMIHDMNNFFLNEKFDMNKKFPLGKFNWASYTVLGKVESLCQTIEPIYKHIEHMGVSVTGILKVLSTLKNEHIETRKEIKDIKKYVDETRDKKLDDLSKEISGFIEIIKADPSFAKRQMKTKALPNQRTPEELKLTAIDTS